MIRSVPRRCAIMRKNIVHWTADERSCLVYVYGGVSARHVGIKLSSTSSTRIGEHVGEGVLLPRIIRSNAPIVESQRVR